MEVMQRTMRSKVVIIGADGYIGRKLTRRLAKEQTVRAFVHGAVPSEFFGNKNIDVIQGDVFDRKILRIALKSGETVVNLVGATTTEENPEQFFRLNVVSHGIVLEECARKKIEKIIFLSSLYIYRSSKKPSLETDTPCPQDTYSLTKVLGEYIYDYYSATFKIPAVVLRVGSVYGPDQQKGIFYNFAKSIREHGAIRIPKKPVYRDFIYIDDLLEAVTRCITCKAKGFECFNICNAKRISLRFLARMIKEKVKVPIAIKYHSAVPSLRSSVGSNQKAKKILEFAPQIDIRHGVEKILPFYFKDYEKN